MYTNTRTRLHTRAFGRPLDKMLDAAHRSVRLAVALVQDLQYPEAVELLYQAVRRQPSYGEAWGNLAAALSQSNRYEEAVKASQEAR